MRLSVLDQSPVASGSTAADALGETVALARAAERMGYSRYWLAEHHGSPGLAGLAPEVLAARVAAATSTIRVGAGGVLLSHYSPLKVAETFGVLAGLFPGRVDLGIGRADGAPPATAAALQAGVTDGALPFGRKLVELLGHLDELPAGIMPPDVWLLASSSDGAGAAASLGLPLCFAHFISTGFGPQIVARYRTAHTARTIEPGPDGTDPGGRPGPAPPPRRRGDGPGPVASVAVAVIGAATDAEAERLATSVDVWRLSPENGRGPVPSVGQARARPRSELDETRIMQHRKGLVVGGPRRVADALVAHAAAFEVEELVILTVCHDPQARLRSYQLLAEALL